ncbi:TMV resistance protein N-like [Rosa rugosa]|uniref:TMV resistance protein N-like n=1 Tax=Rosa rugosa TaxID=74645 RepID=UPI002B41309B|nr:TMV resistance protein N-like [Rosa rugosa]
MASLSRSSAPGSFEYDVFLSFRGPDTRKTFTRQLHEALVRKQINTFIDDEIERGEEIEPTLLQAIEKSKLSVVILSQGYASSTSCLDELAHIFECKKRCQQSVLPIFYRVDPSQVRDQRESYADAFVQHEVHFKDTPDKVRKWRDALTKASKLAGFVSRNIGPDSKLVVEVVRDIVWKLSRKCIAPQDVGEDDCFKCGGIGHWAKHCPSAGECFKCGGLGHWVQHCPSRFSSDEDM